MNKEIVDKITAINEAQFKNLNGRRIISVSKIKGYIKEVFDAEKQAKHCAEKGATDPNYKYANMTAEQILEAWSQKAAESCRYGSLLDEYAEQKFEKDDKSLMIWKLDNNYNYDDRLKGNCLGLDEFISEFKQYGFEYVCREMPMYYQTTPEQGEMPFDEKEVDNVVVGRLYCLFYNPTTKKYLLVDWKTTDSITTEGFRGKKMKGPAYQWDDCDMGEYTVQLHVYKAALAHTYHIADESDIAVCVVNFIHGGTEDGKHYKIYKENFKFDCPTLERVINFSIMKRSLE